ncbi:hypothetical protein M422DRAFT_49719 [Sphaerobolus stellatus SS14]|uniref:Uncharacterized protein n=1 Tax=Sphaerobolus stellatus (strain SS14) TaxID=990650 RepID=A0A0C9VCE3_SPHS4|nr:hypothetical protein M422DRAFT_49719 [Sphaerobolus stellatus SS14]
MNSLCLSLAPNLRCQSLSRIQSLILVIPPALELLFSLTLAFTPNTSLRGQKRWLLVLDGVSFFALALLDVLAHSIPAISTSITPFTIIDLTIAAASFLPLLSYTLFLTLFARSTLIQAFPTRFRRILQITLFALIPFIIASNALGSLLGIAHNFVTLPSTPPRLVLGIRWLSKTYQHIAAFFSFFGVTLLTVFQAAVFTLAFTRCVRAFVDARKAEPAPNSAHAKEEIHMFRGMGWVAAGLKLGAIESVIGFAEGEFGVVVIRRVIRFFGRGALIIGVIKGMNTVEDFTRLDPELNARRNSTATMNSSRQLLHTITSKLNMSNAADMVERKPTRTGSVNRLMISNPRTSTFVHMSPGTTATFYASKGNTSFNAPAPSQSMPPFEDVHDAPFAAPIASSSTAPLPSQSRSNSQNKRKPSPAPLNLGSDSAFSRINAILLAHSGALGKDQLEQFLAGPNVNASTRRPVPEAQAKKRVTVRYDGQTPPVLEMRFSVLELDVPTEPVPPLNANVKAGKGKGALSVVMEDPREADSRAGSAFGFRFGGGDRTSVESMELPIQAAPITSQLPSQGQAQQGPSSFLQVPASRTGNRNLKNPPFPVSPIANNVNGNTVIASHFSDVSDSPGFVGQGMAEEQQAAQIQAKNQAQDIGVGAEGGLVRKSSSIRRKPVPPLHPTPVPATIAVPPALRPGLSTVTTATTTGILNLTLSGRQPQPPAISFAPTPIPTARPRANKRNTVENVLTAMRGVRGVSVAGSGFDFESEDGSVYNYGDVDEDDGMEDLDPFGEDLDPFGAPDDEKEDEELFYRRSRDESLGNTPSVSPGALGAADGVLPPGEYPYPEMLDGAHGGGVAVSDDVAVANGEGAYGGVVEGDERGSTPALTRSGTLEDRISERDGLKERMTVQSLPRTPMDMDVDDELDLDRMDVSESPSSFGSNSSVDDNSNTNTGTSAWARTSPSNALTRVKTRSVTQSTPTVTVVPHPHHRKNRVSLRASPLDHEHVPEYQSPSALEERETEMEMPAYPLDVYGAAPARTAARSRSRSKSSATTSTRTPSKPSKVSESSQSQSHSKSYSLHSLHSVDMDDVDEDLTLMPGMPSSVDDRHAMLHTEMILGRGGGKGTGLVRLDSGVFGRERI